MTLPRLNAPAIPALITSMLNIQGDVALTKGLFPALGVVLTPAQPRRNREGRDLSAKLISAAYAKKETGDELS